MGGYDDFLAGADTIKVDAAKVADIATTLASYVTDTISESTPNAGVTVDGCLIKDGAVAAVSGNVSGNVGGNVAGSVGSVTGNVGGNVGGNVTGSVGSVTGAAGSVTGAVGSVTGNVDGNVGGNVTGSVGSVTGAVGSVTGAVGSVTGAVGSVGGNVSGNVVGTVGGVASTQTKHWDCHMLPADNTGLDWTGSQNHPGYVITGAGMANKLLWAKPGALAHGSTIVGWEVKGSCTNVGAAALTVGLYEYKWATNTETLLGSVNNAAIATGAWSKSQTLASPYTTLDGCTYALKIIGTTGAGDTIDCYYSEIEGKFVA